MKGFADQIRRAVIIDDSRTSQIILEEAIHSGPGFKVVGVANDASTGLDLVKTLSPDLVIINLTMPYIDGAALLTRMTGMPRLCKLIISEQAATNVFMARKLESLGATLCLGKRELSENPQSFLKKIVKACDEIEKAASDRGSADLSSDVSRRSGVRRLRGDVDLGVPIPFDENDRLILLERARLANAVRENQFDLITRHVAEQTDFPVCLLTFIDRDTQWIKSSFGFATGQTARADAFCTYTIASGDFFVVRNAVTDPRFMENPYVVGEPFLRTYAGQPVVSIEGTRVGSLCIFDTRVRAIRPQVPRQLKTFADLIGCMIDSRLALAA